LVAVRSQHEEARHRGLKTAGGRGKNHATVAGTCGWALLLTSDEGRPRATSAGDPGAACRDLTRTIEVEPSLADLDDVKDRPREARDRGEVMRVDHVVDTLEVGGAERLVVALAQHQHRQGASVRVHALYGLGALAGLLVEEGIEVVDHRATPRALGGMRRLTKEFRRCRPDVVHCHNVAATVVGAPAAAMAGVRVAISTRHGWGRREGAWRREMKFWLAARACARIVAVCESARRELAAGPFARPDQIVTIINGAEAPKATRESHAPVDRCVVVSVARLNWAKDHATLLRALAAARSERSEIELHLVGEGAERPALEALADALGVRDAVRFLGERNDVGDCLSDAHLFVLSSVTEGLPVALLEALAMGLTPIVTDVGGMPEVVRQAGVGAVVPPRNAEALASELVRHAMARERWPAWAERARSAFARHFTIGRMCADYDNLVSQCRSA
jgi:glycosyltransferase involved in cell wall biosynthesis